MPRREDPESEWLLMGLGGAALLLVTVVACASLWLGSALWWALSH